MRLLVLVPDAFGGRGGIAKFNRDLLRAVSLHPGVTEVVALPRVMVDAVGTLPQRLVFMKEASGSKVRFVKRLLYLLARDPQFDGVICGHVNLLPLAALAAWRTGSPLLLISHGIEVWEPRGSKINELVHARLSRRLSALVTVSQLTRRRMESWLPIGSVPSFVVPNCVDVAPFGPGKPRQELLERFGLEGSTVLLTLARLSAAERYKGIDEVLEILPRLTEKVPDIKYLICGDGDDRPRLEQKARDLGLASRVTFAGYVAEEEKADHYRLASAFVMPGRGEGFGIVYLEALACGVPVVASSADASREAVLDGELGVVVNPDAPDDILEGILKALRQPRLVPDRLAHFSQERFVERWHAVVDDVFADESSPPPTVSAPRQRVGRALA